MAVLRVREGYTPIEFRLPDSAVIGRSSSAQVRLQQLTISRQHATVELRAGAWVLTDLGSGNGTFVNKERVDGSILLSDGDLVRVGNVELEFSLGGDTGAGTLPGVNPSLEIRDDVRDTSATDSGVLDRLSASAHLSVADDVQAADRMRLLYDLARAVGQSFDETTILQTVIDRLFEVYPQAETAAAVMYDSAHDLLVPKVSRTRGALAAGVQISRSLIREVIQTRSGLMTSDAVGDERFQEFKTLHDLRLRALLCVPMIAGEEVYGVIQLAGSDKRLPFNRHDMLLLLGIAGQTALALANTNLHRRILQQELLDKDLGLATKIQQSFLPQQPPHHERYQFAHRYVPALQVGGDYYGYLEPGADAAGVAVGDVSGKGVSAALYMARLASEIRYLAVGQTHPAPVLERLNDVLVTGGSDGMFVTLILCLIDTKLHRMAVANAGHHPPVVCSSGGSVVGLPVPGNVPLGVMPGAKFEEAMFELDPGDTVVLYTDGVSEAESLIGDQFGTPRVSAALLASDRTPEGAAQMLYERVCTFTAGAVQNDDIAVVAFGPKA